MPCIVLRLVKEVLDIFAECIGSLGGVDSTADHFASHLEDSYCECHSRIAFPSTSNILLHISASVQDFDEDCLFRCHAKSKIFPRVREGLANQACKVHNFHASRTILILFSFPPEVIYLFVYVTEFEDRTKYLPNGRNNSNSS